MLSPLPWLNLGLMISLWEDGMKCDRRTFSFLPQPKQVSLSTTPRISIVAAKPVPLAKKLSDDVRVIGLQFTTPFNPRPLKRGKGGNHPIGVKIRQFRSFSRGECRLSAIKVPLF